MICVLIFQCSAPFEAVTGGVGNDLSTQAVYLIIQCSATFEAITGGEGNDLSS